MGSRAFATTVVMALFLAACGNGSPGEEATPTAGATDTATAAPAPQTEEPEDDDQAQQRPRTYKVKEGDTLSAIAERFNTTVKALVQRNDIKDRNAIKVGQELEIPPGD